MNLNHPGQPTSSAKVPPGTMPAHGLTSTWLAAWTRLNGAGTNVTLGRDKQ